MDGNVADLVRLADGPVGIDEVAVPLGEADLVGARVTRLVLHADLLVVIGQQPEREVVLLPESLVRLRRVEADPEDLAGHALEVSGLVTQAFPLDRPTGGVGHRVPPQQHPTAAQVREPDLVAVLVGKREIRSFDTGLEHGRTLDHAWTVGARGKRQWWPVAQLVECAASRSVRNVAWKRLITFATPTVKQSSITCSSEKWRRSRANSSSS